MMMTMMTKRKDLYLNLRKEERRGEKKKQVRGQSVGRGSDMK